MMAPDGWGLRPHPREERAGESGIMDDGSVVRTGPYALARVLDDAMTFGAAFRRGVSSPRVSDEGIQEGKGGPHAGPERAPAPDRPMLSVGRPFRRELPPHR